MNNHCENIRFCGIYGLTNKEIKKSSKSEQLIEQLGLG
jgi:hypothetical protein